MARKPRIDYQGAWHHVMHRGARRAPVFNSDDHCGTFLGHVAAAVEVFEIEVHAYSLMPNHYHLLIRSPHGEPFARDAAPERGLHAARQRDARLGRTYLPRPVP